MERLFNIKSGERESFPLFELSKLESRGNSDKIELIHSIERIKNQLNIVLRHRFIFCHSFDFFFWSRSFQPI